MPRKTKELEFYPCEIRNIIILALDKSNWRNRLTAVEELSKCKSEKVKEILWDIVLKDKVEVVRKSAYKVLKSWGEKIHFIKLGKPYTSSDIKSAFEKTRKKIDFADIEIETFKNVLREVSPEIYDVLSYENILDRLVSKEFEKIKGDS
jgi:hypothetical protein